MSAEEAEKYARVKERDVGLAASMERRARAVVEAVFSREVDGRLEPPPPDRLAWVTRELDDFLARVTLRTYAVFVLSLLVVTIVAPLLVRRVGFASMELADRVHALERLEKSGLAPALLAVKAMLAIHYYENPDALREIGFDGACLVRRESP